MPDTFAKILVGMSKSILLPEEIAIQLLHALEEFKTHYQGQVVGNTKSASENYLSEKQAAGFLKCSISKIQIFRKSGLIEFFKFGRRILYKEDVLREFVEANSFFAGDKKILTLDKRV